MGYVSDFEEYSIIHEKIDGHMVGHIEEIPQAGKAIGHNFKELKANLKVRFTEFAEKFTKEKGGLIIQTKKEAQGLEDALREAHYTSIKAIEEDSKRWGPNRRMS